MAVGIQNLSGGTITLENITRIINVTGDPAEFFIQLNHIAFQGWFFFFLMLIFGIVLYMIAQAANDQPLINAMYVMASLTVLSFVLRAVTITVTGGEILGLLTDFQMWVFAIFTVVLATIIRFMSR